MRAIIQRVARATVKIDDKINGKIGIGLLVLLGIENEDSSSDIDWLIKKIIQLRIFSDAEGKMNLSVQDVGGDILLVSQFTLFASTKKGNRPSFIQAAKPDVAIPLYEKMIIELEKHLGKKIATGVFGADMQVELINDGPVTLFLDSKNIV
ncbi:MAG TPA: D-aminoacyl-tRNA deacylase [Chitinophagales bacterium]|nr:D-aminoacyl-tRNA deacylase [Chitinophagales bacterium]HNM31314.1 D-aminoacyl-tRNA deacylase [Chitinophagales bacterium]